MSVWGAVRSLTLGPVIALGERVAMRDRRQSLMNRATGRVLEIGAGSGENLAAYPATVAGIVLAEPDPDRRRRLASRVRSTSSAGWLTVDDSPVEALAFADESFDTVASTFVLGDLPDVEVALAEIRRVLKPAGQLLFIEPAEIVESMRRSAWSIGDVEAFSTSAIPLLGAPVVLGVARPGPSTSV